MSRWQLKDSTISLTLLVAVIYLLGFYLYSAIFLILHGYLPAPFFRDVGNSFMDFYNINYHAGLESFYTQFASFYSPLNVLIAQMVTTQGCAHADSAIIYRACSPWDALYFMGFAWLLCLVLIWRALHGCQQQLLWFLLLGFSFPMAFVIERANYLIIAVPILLIWLTTQSRWNLIYEILLANIKYYLIAFQLFYLLRNRFIHVVIFLAALVGSTIIFGTLTGLPAVENIPKNMFNFAAGAGGISVLSDTALNAYIGIQEAFRLNYTSKYSIELLISLIRLLIVIRLWIYLAESRLMLDQHWLNLLILITLFLISSAPGFYGQILLIPYIIYFLKKGNFNNWDKVIIILIWLPYPFKILSNPESYVFYLFNNETVELPLELFLQSIIQPILLFVLFIRLTNHFSVRSQDL